MLLSKQSKSCEVRVAEEDGIIINQHGEVKVEKGQWIIEEENGSLELFDQEYVENNFNRTSKKKKVNVNLDEMMKNYSQSWTNDEDYIF